MRVWFLAKHRNEHTDRPECHTLYSSSYRSVGYGWLILSISFSLSLALLLSLSLSLSLLLSLSLSLCVSVLTVARMSLWLRERPN